MFRPLAWTKTLAVGFSSLLAITLVPPLMLLFIRGRAAAGVAQSGFARHAGDLPPVIRLCLRFRTTTIVAERLFLVVTLPLALQDRKPVHAAAVRRLAALYMPTALPGISIGSGVAADAGAGPDHPRAFPKCESVFGSIGRSDSATDNAPLGHVRHHRDAEAARAVAARA